MKIAGHDMTELEMVALHGLYRGLIRNRRVYGTDVSRQLAALVNRGIVLATGANNYIIPFGGPGARILKQTQDFVISQHLG